MTLLTHPWVGFGAPKCRLHTRASVISLALADWVGESHSVRRIVVTGLPGAGKSTFSRALSAKTGVPLIHLDLHFWQPGWTEPSQDQWRGVQQSLVANDEWILDGNYHDTLALRLERADTAVFLDTPWWLCATRAFVRGVRRPAGTQMPDGCEDSTWRRVRDEWRLVWRIWRVRRSDTERELGILSQRPEHVTLHVLRSKRAVRDFLNG